MRDIAGQLDIQAPSIYSHYPSKEALLQAALRPLLDGLEEVVAAAPPPESSLAERRSWLREYQTLIRRERLAARLLSQDPGVFEHAGLRETLDNWNNQLLAKLTSYGLSPLQGWAVLGAMIVPLLNDSAVAQYDAEIVLDDVERLLAVA